MFDQLCDEAFRAFDRIIGLGFTEVTFVEPLPKPTQYGDGTCKRLLNGATIRKGPAVSTAAPPRRAGNWVVRTEAAPISSRPRPKLPPPAAAPASSR